MRPRRRRRRSVRADSRSSVGSSCRPHPGDRCGSALSFARGVSEYGSLVLLSGNLPMKTEVTSVRILSSIENDNHRCRGRCDDPAGDLARVIVAFDVIQRGSLAVAELPRRRRGGQRRPGSAAHAVAHVVRCGCIVPPTSCCSSCGRSRSWPRTPSRDGFGDLAAILGDPAMRHALRLTVKVALSRWSSTPSSASGSRCCWCATTSPAGAAQRADRPAAVGVAVVVGLALDPRLRRPQRLVRPDARMPGSRSSSPRRASSWRRCSSRCR